MIVFSPVWAILASHTACVLAEVQRAFSYSLLYQHFPTRYCTSIFLLATSTSARLNRFLFLDRHYHVFFVISSSSPTMSSTHRKSQDITAQERHERLRVRTLEALQSLFSQDEAPTTAGCESTMETDDSEMKTQARKDATTTSDGDMSECDNSEMKTQASANAMAGLGMEDFMPSVTQASSTPAREATSIVCPVCLAPVDSVPYFADESELWKGDLRAVRRHCKDRHPEEYLWNVCKREESAQIPLSVPYLIEAAFKTAATLLPLPMDPAFVHSWGCVRMVMCARIALAYRILQNGKTIAQAIARKRNGYFKVFYKRIHAAGRGEYTSLAQSFPKRKKQIKAEAKQLKLKALRYVQELLIKVEHAEAPDEIVSYFPPMQWKSYTSMRKRNLIQLFFWKGAEHRTLQLITDLPPSPWVEGYAIKHDRSLPSPDDSEESDDDSEESDDEE